MPHCSRSLVLLACLLAPSTAVGEEPVDYVTQVKPLLASKCYSCHGALKQESDLRLETRELMLGSGAVVPGKPDGSVLLERVASHDEDRMPPPEDGAALKAEEVALLRRWIEEGATAPDESVPLAPSEHWAFQRIERPALPLLQNSLTPANPIDQFLEAKRAERRLVPQPLADRSIRIRRLYLGLTGLPPTLKQLRDIRPWNEIVDELLASPHHGERWARHWMDIWRYSDWYGLGKQLRYSQKHIWHWRDWIVEALNSDKGYDQMVREMIAGDEYAPDALDTLRATGFLARNYYLFNRTTWLDSTIEHTGKAFLGLTLNCAKCHDHKYDPITHEDYYSFRAIFEPHQVRLDPAPGTTDLERDGIPRVFDDHLDAKTWLHLRGNPKTPDKETKITARVPALFAAFESKAKSVTLPKFAYAPAARDYVQRDQLAVVEAEIDAAQVALKKTEAAAALAKSPVAVPQSTKLYRLKDDFSALDRSRWEVTGDGWKHSDGVLQQTTSTREAAFVRLKQQVPRDFELVCRYTTTGGTTYKSVTFRFDESADRKYANYVYTSAHAPGPKVQVAYTRGGTSVYPQEGRKGRPIEVGRSYELRFAVRERLVNVWLDGEFQLAYVLPDRQVGSISLSGFDATVAFDAIEIRSLDSGLKLRPMGGNSGRMVPDARKQLVNARLKLKAALAKRAFLVAVFKAEAATEKSHGLEATKAEAEYLTAQADYQQAIANGDAKKTSAAAANRKRANGLRAAIRKGEPNYSVPRVSRKALETPAHKESDYAPTYSMTSTGRRRALAEWMTHRDNPLFARVATNHVWLRHFGQPLVESVFDFGLRAEKPEHAELLDYLAAKFIESGYSFKQLHRLIVTSHAYQLSSSTRGADGDTLAADLANRFYWRRNTQRMQSQVVRDSLLALSGKLDRRLGGPALDVGNKCRRRSIYFKHSRDQHDKFLTMFDDADLLQCYRRDESIVPQQALALSNSKLAIELAADVAASIAANGKLSREEFAAVAFEALLARQPTTDEVEVCLSYCGDIEKLIGERSDREKTIRSRLVQTLINHNDFISIR